VRLQVEPAHAKVGLGMWYELRNDEVYVTRLLTESPAARAGIKRGDQIVKIEGQDVATMESGRAQSLINSNASVGVKLSVKHADGKVTDLVVKNGPIYPLVDEELSGEQ
jgi:C-terminal processing protease CtpA/Prc